MKADSLSPTITITVSELPFLMDSGWGGREEKEDSLTRGRVPPLGPSLSLSVPSTVPTEWQVTEQEQ